jgi:hypothetical protein
VEPQPALVAAVRRVVEHLDVGAEAAEDLRRRAVRRAVGAIERDPAAAQVEAGEALVQRAQVVLQRALQRADAADRRGGGAVGRLQRALDLQLDGVGQLEPVAAEELDAVVAVRVVRGAQDDAEVERVATDQERRAGRREHAAEQRFAAGGGDARGDRGLEHLAGLAGVADDEHAGHGGVDAPRRRTGERQRQFRGQELPGDSPHPVGAEELAGQAVSASRTAAACGPS